jgi:hypothetical protein
MFPQLRAISASGATTNYNERRRCGKCHHLRGRSRPHLPEKQHEPSDARQGDRQRSEE